MSFPRQPARPWRDLAAIVLLLALAIGLYWKLTLSREYTWLQNPDQGLQVRPWLDFQARELHAGRLPLWDPYLWAGQTLIGQVQPGLTNPLNWILFALPLSGGHISLGALDWYWVSIRFLAAVFAFLLCRDLRCGLGPSILGGSIYGFAGFIGYSLSPQFAMSALWLPIVLLFFARVFRGRRPWSGAALGGAALGAAFLSGHHNIPIYTAVLMGGLWLWHLARAPRHRREYARRAGQWAAFTVVWLLVAAVQLLPAVEYGKRALRWADAPEALRWQDRIPYSVHARYSLSPESLPGLVIPGIPAHANPFVGIVAVTLALAAVLLRWRSAEVRLFAGVALGGLLLALGSATPVHRIAFELVPMVEKARYPAFAVVVCQVGLAALAALGLEAWRQGLRSRIVLWWLACFAAAAAAVYQTHRFPLDPRALLAAAVALALAAALYWWRPVAIAAVLLLFLAEAYSNPPRFERRDLPGSYLKLMDDQADIAEFLRRQPGWFRVIADENVVPYNFGDWFAIEQYGGYLASMTVNIHDIAGHPDTPRLLGIRYSIARAPSNPSQREVFQSRSGLKVYQDPRIADPLWTRHDAPCPAADRLRMAARVPNAFSIEADLACPGLLVEGDPYFPGWRAWVDGQRVRIRESEGVVRAVPVPAGRHRIEFRYVPGSVWWGVGLSAFGLLAAALSSVVDRRRVERCAAAQ